jgi:hypothetical protein
MISIRQTSQVGLLTRACTSTRSILENVLREQLALSAPCHEWHIHDLINHIVGATDFFADIAERGRPSMTAERNPSGMPHPCFRASRMRLVDPGISQWLRRRLRQARTRRCTVITLYLGRIRPCPVLLEP